MRVIECGGFAARGVRGERGSAAAEWALLAPVFVLVAAVLVAGLRLGMARAEVTDAAASAARLASQGSPGQAQARARAWLAGTDCRDAQLVVDAAAFTSTPGDPGAVRVQVSCAVPLADLVVPGLPGVVRVSADATSVVDRYRER